MPRLHPSWFIPVLVTVATCGHAARDEGAGVQRTADSEHTAIVPGSNPAFKDTASQKPSHKPPSLAGEALAICDTVANAWRPAKGAEVTRAESTFYAFPAGDSVSACHVSMVAPKGLSAVDWRASYWGDSLSMGRVGRGWTDLMHWDGDGPGSMSRVMMRNGVRCHISDEFDAGSDDDSTYVPSPRESQVTSCWLGPATLTPRDTGGTD